MPFTNAELEQMSLSDLLTKVLVDGFTLCKKHIYVLAKHIKKQDRFFQEFVKKSWKVQDDSVLYQIGKHICQLTNIDEKSLISSIKEKIEEAKRFYKNTCAA